MDPEETTNTAVKDPEAAPTPSTNGADAAAKDAAATDETVTISKKEWERTKSIAGSALKQAERDAVLQRIADEAAEARREAKMARRLSEMNVQEMDPKEREKQLSQLTAEERQAQEAADVDREINRFAPTANRKLQRAGISETDSRVAKALGIFEQAREARTTAQAKRLLEQANDLVDEAFEEAMDAKEKAAIAKATAAEKELEKVKKDIRQAEREDAADMSTGAAAGGSGNPTLESLSKKDTRRMTPKELREHEQAIDAALRRGR